MPLEILTLQTAIIIVVIASAAIGIGIFVNKSKSPQPLPLKKPRLEFFPKYYVTVPLAGGSVENLQQVMEQKGFRTYEHKSGKKYFERGSVLGEFSISINWLKLRISEMEGVPGRLSIAYGGSVLFDTGDLWKLAKEIENILVSQN